MKTLRIIEKEEITELLIAKACLARLLGAENLTSEQKETINDALLAMRFIRSE